MQATTTFHSLYEAHAQDVYRFARFLTGSDDAAADVTSETFLRAWTGRDAIRAETAKAYLLAIARNLARDRARAAQPDLRTRDVPRDARWRPTPKPRLELNRTLDAHARAAVRLSRTAAAARSRGVGYDEIGRMLGLSVGHRARSASIGRARSWAPRWRHRGDSP